MLGNSHILKRTFGANSYKGFDKPTPFLNVFQKLNIFVIFLNYQKMEQIVFK